MARRKNRYRRGRPPITLALQDWHIKRRFPTFTFRREPGGGAVWRGTLQPRETSPAYRILLRYKVGSLPRVWVTWPKLAPGAPHLYPGERLCLYWPEEWFWSSQELIAETILPWTALWLYYYELWLDCGDWLGPSSHVVAPDEDESLDGA